MIRYLIGDATAVNSGPPASRCSVILAHVVNDVPGGAWGAGFSGAVSRRWPGSTGPEAHYRCWATLGNDPQAGRFALGNVLLVPVGNGIIVANMIAQHGINWRPYMSTVAQQRPIRYSALRTCLAKVGEAARFNGCVVVCPRIGTGLAGGDWREIEPIIETELVGRGVEVTVYDLAAVTAGQVD